MVREESLPISALQHWLFCPRQSALIHVERLWEENRLTAEGQVLHERADEGIPESRDGKRILRSVHIASNRLGVHGLADVVEMQGHAAFPVEYKRGRPKNHRADEVQLCAQALCLEEMTGHEVPEGALFYGVQRRRQVVVFDAELRTITERVAREARDAVALGILPPPVYEPDRCDSCSLHQLCRPQARNKVSGWMARQLARSEVPECLLNTLYVATEGARLRKDGETIAVEIDGQVVKRSPAHLLGQIVLFRETSASPDVMHFAATSGISMAWLGYSGKLMARIEGPQSGNVLLRRAQHRATADVFSARFVAKAIVAAKIANQRAVLRRHLRDYPAAQGAEYVDEAQRRLADAARHALNAPDLDNLRGYEGEGAHAYWQVFKYLIRVDDTVFSFEGRNRRPPRDAVNALLSFLYALLALDARAACETHGLDPQMGFLHRDRPGRMSLALDLMEELRAPLADRVALSLINRRQITRRDFDNQDTGAVLLNEKGRRTVLQAYHDRKRVELRHAWLDERMVLGLVPQIQAQLLARHLRGDLDGYPAWVW